MRGAHSQHTLLYYTGPDLTLPKGHRNFGQWEQGEGTHFSIQVLVAQVYLLCEHSTKLYTVGTFLCVCYTLIKILNN